MALFDGLWFQQTIGIPIGTTYAPLLAVFFPLRVLSRL